MLIPFENLPISRRHPIRGVIHIGAHEAEELSTYVAKGVERVIWIEANPGKIPMLTSKLLPHPKMRLACFAAGESSNETAKLNISNNAQSSSILAMKEHQAEHPDIFYVKEIDVPLISIDDYFPAQELSPKNYNFMNLDIQGYELHALKGARQQLNHVDYIYTEVNTKELYAGCALIEELDNFLLSLRFERLLTSMTDHGWGNAFYMKRRPNLFSLKG